MAEAKAGMVVKKGEVGGPRRAASKETVLALRAAGAGAGALSAVRAGFDGACAAGDAKADVVRAATL